MRRLALLLALVAPNAALADPADDAATAAFKAAFASYCGAAFAEDGSLIEPPERFEMQSASSWGEPAPMTLWQFRCNMGAYNLQSVFIGQSEMSGMVPLAFARPDLDVVLEDPDNYEGPVKEVRITGYSAAPYVVNASVDAAAGRVSEYSAWRGIGDASSTAVWALVDESFRLMRFEVDPTYDGEITPAVLVSFE